jgi:transcriptional regulator with XRE-family HTH domain
MADEYEAELKRIGRLIAHRRELRSWSQEELARELGPSVSTVSRWERGEQPPSKRYRGNLAELLDVDVALLIPAEPSRQAGPRPGRARRASSPGSKAAARGRIMGWPIARQEPPGTRAPSSTSAC